MICNTANAMLMLFNESLENLDSEKLKWLSGLYDTAELQFDNIAETLSALAGMFGDENAKAARPSDEALSAVLYGLAESLQSASSTVRISSEAVYELQKRKNNAQ